MNLRRLLRSLSHRNYRLFFAGQSISLIGTWMQQIAISWLVYIRTSSSTTLAVVLFSGQVPALVLAPFAGVLTDRWNRHRMLLWTQSLAMAQAFLLAGLTLTDVIQIWHLVLLSLLLGVVNIFDMTARQTFLTEMVVSREDLGNAIALNSSMVNGARLVGPTVAGFLLAETNAGICFLVNGVSYLAVLAALLAMRLPPRPRLHRASPLGRGLTEGFQYAFGFAPIRSLLLLLGLASMAAMSYTVLLPEFTIRVLRGDGRVLGLLTAASGVGALAGALFLASRSSVLGLGRCILVSLGLLGLGLMGFAVAGNLWSAMTVLFVIGCSMMVQMASTNTLLQTITDEDKRGRVLSFYAMAFLGMAPIGSLLTGLLAAETGLLGAFLVNGVACLLGALAFALHLPHLRTLVRPIYVRLRILPEIVTGISTASELERTAKE